MSGKPSIDNELERLLAGEETATSALYRKLPAAAPDEKLDAAVLALAHRAVNPHLRAAPRQARSRPRLSPAWLALGSAAGLVLAAGVAWQMRTTIEQNSRESALRGAVAPATEGRIEVQARNAPERKADTTVAPAAAAVNAATAVAAPPPAVADRLNASQERAAAADKEKTAPRKQEEARPEPRARREQPGVTEYTLPAGAAGPAPKPFPAAPAAAPAASAQATAPSPPPPAEAPRTAPAEFDAVERKARLASGVAPADASGEKAAAPAPNAPAAAATPPAPRDAAPSRSLLLQNNARLAPDTWIGVMRDLLREDRRAEARENLDLFRRKYPDYRLPADLAALAREP